MKKHLLKKLVTIVLLICLTFNGIPVLVHAESDSYLFSEIQKSNRIYKYDGYTIEFRVTDYWAGAYNAQILLKNTGTRVIDNWNFSFDLSGEISNIWNAAIINKEITDNEDIVRYTVKNKGYNADIPVGGLEFS